MTLFIIGLGITLFIIATTFTIVKIQDKDEDVWWMVLIWILLIILLVSIIVVKELSYKEGQVDALSKKDILYELTVLPDSTRVWTRKADYTPSYRRDETVKAK